jgi:type II secretory pathway pseudopilin PulG
MFHNLNGNKGISMMEILIVIAILAVSVTSLLGLISFSLISSTINKSMSQADALAQETIEQVRNFRDGTYWSTDGLGTLSVGTDYYPEQSGSPPVIQITAGTQTISGFTKKVVFENVSRDTDDNIVSSGGTLDPSSKKLTVTISWQERGRNHQRQLITYLTNWRDQ